MGYPTSVDSPYIMILGLIVSFAAWNHPSTTS